MTDKIITDQDALRVVSKPTTIQEVKKLDLLNRLREAMRGSWTHGCGLVAIQIGIPLRFGFYVFEQKEYILFNPEIVCTQGSFKAKQEGCLSIPNNYVRKKRWYKVKYTMDGYGMTRQYVAKNFKGRIVQHEVDHMNGILNIDEVNQVKIVGIKNKKLKRSRGNCKG